MVHAEADGRVERALPALTRLKRNAAHKVDRDVEAGGAGGGNALPRAAGIVDAAEGAQLAIVEALRPEGDARESAAPCCSEHVVGKGFGIRLEARLEEGCGDLIVTGFLETGKPLGPEHSRRPPAHVKGVRPSEQARRTRLADEPGQRSRVSVHEGIVPA